MAKPYYAEYVNHILRFYFRYNPNKGFKNDVDKMNYLAADKVIQKLTEAEQEVLCLIFNMENIHVVDNVSVVARQRHQDPTKIWTLISTTTSKIAKERKLL